MSAGYDYEMRVLFATAALPLSDTETLRQHLRMEAEEFIRQLATVILSDHENGRGAWGSHHGAVQQEIDHQAKHGHGTW